MHTARDQTGKVRHVHQVERADFVGDLPHAREINDAGIRAATADNHLGALFFGKLLQVVVIDGLSFLGHSVGDDAISLSREIEMVPVREVAAVRQVQTENGVAGLQHCGVSFHVGLRSGVWLDVGVFRSEKLLGTFAREVFHYVGELAPSVVALAGIAFGILIGEHRAHGFQHGFADEIFRGDQFQSFVLAADFVVDGRSHLGIGFVERAGHVDVFHLNLRKESNDLMAGFLVNVRAMKLHIILRFFQRLEPELRV